MVKNLLYGIITAKELLIHARIIGVMVAVANTPFGVLLPRYFRGTISWHEFNQRVNL